jgi:hypothetical protein
MKKRLIALLLVLVLIMSNTGCSLQTGGLRTGDSSIKLINSQKEKDNNKQISTVIDRAVLETKDWNDPDLLLKVRWDGVNFYEFVLPNGKTIVMDPYFDTEPAGGHNEYNYTPTELPAGEWVNGADYVALTHGHFDHTDDLDSILQSYPKAHIIAPEHVMPAIIWQLKLEYSTHYFHEAAAIDKLSFDGFTLETCRSNHNLSNPPKVDQMNTTKYTDSNGNLDFYKLYRTIYEREIMNMKITTDEGFSFLIWNSEMQPDGYGFEDREWFYQDSKPDLFMYQVAGASLGYDRRNPNYQHMGEWIASINAAAALPEHQQHFSYDELDIMAGEFSEICNEQNVDTEFLTPETGTWYGYTKDANGNVNVYKVNTPSE